MFERQEWRNMKVYFDDMMIKTKFTKDHVLDLKEVFVVIEHYKMCLNPKKWVFGVTLGKFLGYLVSLRGIEANLDKMFSIFNMISPEYLKEIQ